MKLNPERKRVTPIRSTDVLGEKAPVESGFNLETEVDEATWKNMREALKGWTTSREEKIRMQAYMAVIDPTQLHWKLDKKFCQEVEKRVFGNFYPKTNGDTLVSLALLKRLYVPTQPLNPPFKDSFVEKISSPTPEFPEPTELAFLTMVLFPELRKDIRIPDELWEEELRKTKQWTNIFPLDKIALIRLVSPEHFKPFEQLIRSRLPSVRAMLRDKIIQKANPLALLEGLFALVILQAEVAEITPKGEVIIQPKIPTLPTTPQLPERTHF